MALCYVVYVLLTIHLRPHVSGLKYENFPLEYSAQAKTFSRKQT
jgi:hypothetical protein